MSVGEAFGLVICVFAVVGFFVLFCRCLRFMSGKEKLVVGVRVSHDESPDEVHQRLMGAKLEISDMTGIESSPVLLVDMSGAERILPEELYIEFGDVDIYVKLPDPREVP